MFLRTALPGHHLSDESRDVVKLATGLVGTMAALVLGLLVASAKGSFDAQSTELTQMSANIVVLDRTLAHYGPEAKETREALRNAVAGVLNQSWSKNRFGASRLEPAPVTREIVYDSIQALTPRDDVQRSVKSQALAMAVRSSFVSCPRKLSPAFIGGKPDQPVVPVLTYDGILNRSKSPRLNSHSMSASGSVRICDVIRSRPFMVSYWPS